MLPHEPSGQTCADAHVDADLDAAPCVICKHCDRPVRPESVADPCPRRQDVPDPPEGEEEYGPIHRVVLELDRDDYASWLLHKVAERRRAQKVCPSGEFVTDGFLLSDGDSNVDGALVGEALRILAEYRDFAGTLD